MAVRTRMLQLSIAAVNLVIIALAFTSIWPFPNGDVKVDLPSPNEISWTLSDGVVHVTAPYSIDNGGYYDIEDLEIRYRVTNYTNTVLASETMSIGSVPAGRTSVDELDFTFDLQHMYDSGAAWMVFNDDLLVFDVEVSCYYTLRLVRFEAQYDVSVPWEAIIQEVEVDDFQMLGAQLVVDYHITTSELLSGSAQVIVRLYDGSVLLDEELQTIYLGRTSQGTATFTVPAGTEPDRVLIESQIAGFLLSEQFAVLGVSP